MTNAEKIKSMSNLELAEERVCIIADDYGTLIYYTSCGNFDNLQDAINDELKWLNSECK